MTKQYAERDAMALDEVGGYYMRHVMAMTGEQLHGKGNIAAELGWRDMQIAALQQKLDAVLAENVALKDGIAKANAAVEHWNSWADKEDKISLHIKTPATDAILNEVRAEGVDMVAESLIENGVCTSSHTVAYFKQFAAKIRAGSTEGGV